MVIADEFPEIEQAIRYYQAKYEGFCKYCNKPLYVVDDEQICLACSRHEQDKDQN
jgi:hypothetical protein